MAPNAFQSSTSSKVIYQRVLSSVFLEEGDLRGPLLFFSVRNFYCTTKWFKIKSFIYKKLKKNQCGNKIRPILYVKVGVTLQIKKKYYSNCHLKPSHGFESRIKPKPTRLQFTLINYLENVDADELVVKKLDPKHKALVKNCFQYSAIFKVIPEKLLTTNL